MKKIFKYMIFLLVTFIFNAVIVSAKSYTGSYLPSCINDGTCLLACEYEIDIHDNGTEMWKFAIYYTYSSKQLQIVRANGKQRYFWKVNNKHIFYEKELFSENYSSCPNYAFHNIYGIDESCFSFNKDYCLNIEGTWGIGKKFDGKSKKTYDFADQIKLYFSDNDNYFYDVTCDNFDLSNLETKLVNDFSKNYLNGHDLPSFIENNEVYKTQKQAQKDKIKKYLEKCKKEITSDENKTDSQKQESLNKLNYSDEEIDEMLEKVDSDINNYEKLNYQKASKLECAGLLGSITNPDEPAYYISMSFNIIKYLATIFLIVFTIVDYIKAVVSKDDEELSKTNAKFVKRFIFAIIIFVLPSLIIMVLEWGGLINDPSICGI